MTVVSDRIDRLAAQLHDASVYAAQLAQAREQPGKDGAPGDSQIPAVQANPCSQAVPAGAGRDHTRPLTGQRPAAGPRGLQGGEVATVMGLIAGTLTVPGRVQDVRSARRFVGQVMEGRPCQELAVLLTSEVVTNSILHSRSGDGGKVTIVLIDFGAAVRVEVVDDGSDHLLPRVAACEPELADRGRGLQIVEQAAARWGHYRDDHGLTTWFELSDAPDAGPDDGNPALSWSPVPRQEWSP